MKEGLETLGFSTCYHMFEFMEHPEHARYWDAALRGKKVAWGRTVYGLSGNRRLARLHLLSGIDGAVSGCQGRFERPRPRTLVQERQRNDFYGVTRWAEAVFSASHHAPDVAFAVGRDSADSRRTFGGKEHDKAHAIRVFEAHIEEVKRVVPPEKLLVYEVKEGWEPLCRFLEVPVPASPFPHVNDTQTFQEDMKVRFRRGTAKTS